MAMQQHEMENNGQKEFAKRVSADDSQLTGISRSDATLMDRLSPLFQADLVGDLPGPVAKDTNQLQREMVVVNAGEP